MSYCNGWIKFEFNIIPMQTKNDSEWIVCQSRILYYTIFILFLKNAGRYL